MAYLHVIEQLTMVIGVCIEEVPKLVYAFWTYKSVSYGMNWFLIC